MDLLLDFEEVTIKKNKTERTEMELDTNGRNYFLKLDLPRAGVKFSMKKNDDPFSFITKCEEQLKASGATDDAILRQIPLCLEDSSNLWWRSRGNRFRDWKEFRKAFLDEFLPADYQLELADRIRDRIQLKDESFGNFLYAIEDLASRLSQRLTEQELIHIIIRNINPNTKQHFRERITSLDELRKIGKTLEREELDILRYQRLETTSTVVKIPNVRFEQIRPWNPDHQNDRGRFRQKQEHQKQTQDFGRNGIRCFGCGTPNVYRANCTRCNGRYAQQKRNVNAVSPTPLELPFHSPGIQVNITQEEEVCTVAVIGTVEIEAMLDSGAWCSLISRCLVNNLPEVYPIVDRPCTPLLLADGSQMLPECWMEIPISVFGRYTYVTFAVVSNLNNHLILGRDFLRENGVTLHFSNEDVGIDDSTRKRPKYTFKTLEELKKEEVVEINLIDLDISEDNLITPMPTNVLEEELIDPSIDDTPVVTANLGDEKADDSQESLEPVSSLPSRIIHSSPVKEYFPTTETPDHKEIFSNTWTPIDELSGNKQDESQSSINLQKQLTDEISVTATIGKIQKPSASEVNLIDLDLFENHLSTPLQPINMIGKLLDKKSHLEISKLTSPKSASKDVPTKISGKVKWFHVKKGYGFINSANINKDIFIHWTSISKNNPHKIQKSVGDGELVEFDLVVNSKGYVATNVTGPDGAYLIGSRYAADRRSSKSRWKRHRERRNFKKEHPCQDEVMPTNFSQNEQCGKNHNLNFQRSNGSFYRNHFDKKSHRFFNSRDLSDEDTIYKVPSPSTINVCQRVKWSRAPVNDVSNQFSFCNVRPSSLSALSFGDTFSSYNISPPIICAY